MKAKIKKIFYGWILTGMLAQHAFPLYGNPEISLESEREFLQELVEELRNTKARLLQDQEEEVNEVVEKYQRKSSEELSLYKSELNGLWYLMLWVSIGINVPYSFLVFMISF